MAYGASWCRAGWASLWPRDFPTTNRGGWTTIAQKDKWLTGTQTLAGLRHDPGHRAGGRNILGMIDVWAVACPAPPGSG
jgi:hypothetical protein